MKKLILIIVFFVFFSFFVNANIVGLDWQGADSAKFTANTTDEAFILQLNPDEEVTAIQNLITKDLSYSKKVYLILNENSKLFNKPEENLKIDSSVIIVMKGANGAESVIHSKGKNLLIDANLFIEGNSVISSSGENGADGNWNGPKDEGDICRHDSDACNAVRPCSMDRYWDYPDHENDMAEDGGNAGILSVNYAEIKAKTVFSADGGKGGNGSNGKNEHEAGRGQEAIGGGNGGNGGNAGNINVNYLNIVSGSVNFSASGGNGGNGGRGGNDIGDEDHLGGFGGNGGNSASVEILNLSNPSFVVSVTSWRGNKGTGGKVGDGSSCSYGVKCIGAICSGIRPMDGDIGELLGNAFISFFSGYAPFGVTARNVLIKAKPLNDAYFFPNTHYYASENLEFNACRLLGAGMEYSDSELVSMKAGFLDVNVWNPLKFFDRVLFETGKKVSINKNYSCNLNPRYAMEIPFNGRIHNLSEGIIKNIRIVNPSTSLTEFEDSERKTFSSGKFSSVLTAELYANTVYKIYFAVCNDTESVCENFSFDFFTWRKLWNA